jgi:proteasome accessory factor B
MAFNHAQHGLVERMLRIHAELRKATPINCTKLTKLLEVSRPTVLRDIAFMRDRLDLPIAFDPVHNTYRYTAVVDTFPTLRITEGEVLALLVARKALEQYRGTPFHRQLAASFEKISASLTDEVSFSPTDEMDAVSFKNVGLGKADMEVFNALSRGIVRQQEIEFDYKKPGDTRITRRHVQPYHLANRENLWYLIGFDLQRKALRTFAVPRISNPAVLKTKFERPADFSPEKFFANALGVLSGDGNYHVVIRFRSAVADRVRERWWHESQTMRDLPDGRLELMLRLGALAEIARWVLSWGAEAEVIQPPELREQIKATGLALAKQY